MIPFRRAGRLHFLLYGLAGSRIAAFWGEPAEPSEFAIRACRVLGYSLSLRSVHQLDPSLARPAWPPSSCWKSCQSISARSSVSVLGAFIARIFSISKQENHHLHATLLLALWQIAGRCGSCQPARLVSVTALYRPATQSISAGFNLLTQFLTSER